MKEELLYDIALTMVPHIGDVHAKFLVEQYGTAAAVFRARKNELEKWPGIGEIRARSIREFSNFKRVEEELVFLDKFKVRALAFNDEDYPKRLRNCYDAPILLYYRGNASLNTSKIISIIGTRNNTDYGREMVREILEDLAPFQVLVVSGLAYGVDSVSHKFALKNHLPTVGVLAHGLDRIYPPAHKTLAKDMLENGGLLTDFMTGTNPDKQNFPKRNRIVAGMADAVLVVETGIKGGSMITAEIANSYNKDVFALPGRIHDVKSEGCHYLIRQNKAMLVTSAADILETMNWESRPVNHKIQKELFVELTPEEKTILSLIREQEDIHLDELFVRSGLRSSVVAASALQLEIRNIIKQLPGKRYRLC